jgi:hypothetical protein
MWSLSSVSVSSSDSYNSQVAKCKATLQIVKGIPEGEQCVPPPPVNPIMVDTGDNGVELDTAHDKFSLHPDNPSNFLRLSAAL